MTFDEFLNQAWNDHGKNPQEVAQRLFSGQTLIERNEQIPLLAHLTAHVLGEHLAQWEQGLQSLAALKTNPHFVPNTESEWSIQRLMASLQLSSGHLSSLNGFSTSDQIRILTVSSSALCEQKEIAKAIEYFNKALSLASSLGKKDPANRALAVAGNNLAATLEEKEHLNDNEKKLMLLAAQTGRTYWEIAGTWLQVERAEYRFAMSCLKACDFASALQHANLCLQICSENSAPALEFFFGYEALAKIEKASGRLDLVKNALEKMLFYYDQLSEQDKSWTEKTLEQFR